MSARTMQVLEFQGDVIAPGHHDDYDARAVRNGTVDLFHANQDIAPAKRR